MAPGDRSGGKILKSRKTSTRPTPYDRPIAPQPPPESPNNNWLTGLVSPAKFVTSGATKILSSLWNPNTWSTHSDSSSSDSEPDSEDDSGDDENPADATIELIEQHKGRSSQKTETLHLIEQLLMLEQYSREECDRLIEIINSRVVDYSKREGWDAGTSMIRSSTDNGTPDIRSQAIMEAKKWIEENKVRSGKKPKMDNGFYALKSVVTPQATEGDPGSPIDVAKSYMKARPPWASPINHDNSLTPSPLAAELFKERTPYSSGAGTSVSSAKRDSFSAGKWNIQEEIRRVRTKATEDMLSSHRSTRLSTLEHHTPKRSLSNDKIINDVVINLGTPIASDGIVNLSADGNTPGLSDIRTTQDDTPTDMVVLEQQQVVRSSDGNDLEKEEDGNQIEKNCYLMTESLDIPPINYSQGSSNNEDHSLATKIDEGTPEKRAVTRGSKNTRRGKGRGK